MQRRDIDGMRALAVCAVIANHFSERVLPGGYLGVDIFFVISGFVITLSLLRQPEANGRAFLTMFYLRRIRRILPALLVCVLLSAPLFVLFDPNPRLTLVTGATSLFGLSNFYLLHGALDYFSYNTKFNGFTHTWSLGIEEQFYLIYPALFWFVLRRKKVAILTLAGLILASFALFAWFEHRSPIHAFYLIPFRFWELAVGAMLARCQPPKQNRVSQAGAWAGLALVCFSLVIPPQFAASGTLIAVAGSAMLIHFGSANLITSRVLELKPMQWIGRISYSLYLWHWPVVSLSRWTVGIHLWLVPVQLALMFGLAAASYRFVEQPWRRPRTGERPGRTIVIGLSFSAVLALGLLALSSPVVSGKLFTGRKVQLLAKGAGSLVEPLKLEGYGQWSGKPCVFGSDDDAKRAISASACTLGNSNARHHALVIGNSFTAAFAGGFAPLVKDHGYSVTLFGSFWASPGPTVPNTTNWKGANAAMWQRVYPELSRMLGKGDLVVLASDFALLAPDPATAESRAAIRIYGEDISRMSSDLRARGIRLAVVDTLPFVRDIDCKVEMGMEQWYTPFGSPCRFPSRESELKRRAPIDSLLREKARRGEIVLLDFFDIFCPGATCGYTRPDVGLVYRDEYSHASVEVMPLVGRETISRLREAGVLTP